MAETLAISEISIITRRFGGLTAFSRALGHKHSSTVQGWYESGIIPHWRRHEIIIAAKKYGIPLPRSFRKNGAR